ncbi:MAG: tryptophan-rich sensory protein [Myxococcales bacterium]|nr:tryptophan-rich sensory protein [Myxococcales bacterium]
MERILSFLPFLLGVAGAGWIGAQFEPGVWYAALQKPALTPPNAIFGPVWTLIYLAIAVAGWRVFRAGAHFGARALWIVQLVLNGLWSYLFFGIHRMGWALVEIAGLWLIVVVATAVFWRIEKTAGLLFVPYALWVSFAMYLNAGLWFLNRG